MMTRSLVLSCLIMISAAGTLCCQDKLSVQVKTFDQALKPLGNLELSVNANEFFQIGPKGSKVIDIPQADLPPKSVSLKNEELEAESWNYSKGVLEIIVRKKTYRVIAVNVRLSNGKPVSDVRVVFNGRKRFDGVTDASGKVSIPLAVNESITSQGQFTVDRHTLLRIQNGENECTLYVQAPVVLQPPPLKTIAKQSNGEGLDHFDLKNLDSIQSITVFYAIFKNYRMGDLSEEEKQMVDRKFQQLMLQLEDSLRGPSDNFLGRISDSSFVGDDVKNLLAQAESEEATLDYLRGSFDDKIRVLNEKLAAGTQNMDPETRGKLITDINRLEEILRQNSQKFYKNQTDYMLSLNSLKEKFFETQDLEDKLSLSEAQRLEDKKEFQTKILTVVLITLGFAVVTVMLTHFSSRLKKQKAQLEVANSEITRINENLESLVSERTALLENAHREMDIFLYKASHDLRGPICSIIGLCNIASRTVDADALEIIQKTYSTAFSMDRMLRKLKVISEINHPSNYSLVILDEHVRAVKQEFRKFILDNKVKLQVDCPAAISFHSYPNLVEVILVNLVENALYFSTLRNEGSPHVQIKAVHHKKYVEFRVRDNGIGIETDIQDRVWDMFFIGTEHSHGNGLGLYIVRKSVQVLQGTINLVSEKDRFTEVIVQIPVVDAVMIPARQQPHLLAERENYN
jgi:signal transduction histidine kinase